MALLWITLLAASLTMPVGSPADGYAGTATPGPVGIDFRIAANHAIALRSRDIEITFTMTNRGGLPYRERTDPVKNDSLRVFAANGCPVPRSRPVRPLEVTAVRPRAKPQRLASGEWYFLKHRGSKQIALSELGYDLPRGTYRLYAELYMTDASGAAVEATSNTLVIRLDGK